MYQLRHGDSEDMIIRECANMGRELPGFIKNAPELPLCLAMYYEAFFDLHSCRSSGMGLGMIPWTSVQQYADLSGFDEDQAADLHYYIRCMDNAFLKWQEEKRGANK